jgi:hypothetical protein
MCRRERKIMHALQHIPMTLQYISPLNLSQRFASQLAWASTRDSLCTSLGFELSPFSSYVFAMNVTLYMIFSGLSRSAVWRVLGDCADWLCVEAGYDVLQCRLTRWTIDTLRELVPSTYSQMFDNNTEEAVVVAKQLVGALT